MGQDEFYGEQYGHTQSSSEPINQQYYPDGNHARPLFLMHTAQTHKSAPENLFQKPEQLQLFVSHTFSPL